MAVLEQSPFFHQIIEQSPFFHQIVRKEVLKILRRQLQRRFGEVLESVQVRLEKLDREQLEALTLEVISVASLDEFIAAIPPVPEA